MQNILKAILYLKVVLYKCANKHSGYLISFCDAAYLNTDIINKTIENMDPHNAGLVMHYIHKDTIAKAGFPVENRTFLNIAGEKYTGSNVYYVRSLRKLVYVLSDLAKIRKWRKEPHKILEHLESTGKPFSHIEKVISRKMHDKVKIFVSPFAEMGVDVDKPIDYELTKFDGPKKRLKFLEEGLEKWEEDWKNFEVEAE